MQRYLLFFSFLFTLGLHGQAIFPDLEGQELIDAVATNFRPASVYDYNTARDTLYAKIDSRNDSLYCVYTGFGIALNPGEDPTIDAFAKGINTEHTWPRSRGAEFGAPLSDMHHLFPTRVQVNADRGSLPFGNIPDNQATSWYFMAQENSNPPAVAVRDQWSELLPSVRFEPREDHKGNVARAMFYFYTIYRQESDAVDPNFFPPQIADLCEWHLDDPVDARELDRTYEISLRQDGKVNPFVVDCNLLMRAYCPDLAVQNCISSVDNPTNQPAPFKVLGVGKTAEYAYVMLSFAQAVNLHIDWYDTLGRKVSSESKEWLEEGIFQLNVRTAAGARSAGNSNNMPLIGRLRLQASNGNWYTASVIIP